MVLAAAKGPADTKEQIKAQRRLARQAMTREERQPIQGKIPTPERQQCRQRQEFLPVEDEILARRDQFIDVLERGFAQRT